MDYEQLYKNALAHAREIHRNEEEKRRDMEWLFPELKESDERIRKVLIDYFKEQEECAIKTFFGIPIDNILAWLKKQGEQKPADKVKAMSHSYITPNPEFFQWIYDRLVDVHNENPDMDYMRSLRERIKDMQKPAWSKNDEETLESLSSLLQDYGSPFEGLSLIGSNHLKQE